MHKAMKKTLLLFALIMFVGLIARAQTCGPYIDMFGQGIADQEGSASMSIPDFGDYDMMVVEAIYKAPDAPEAVIFRTATQEVSVEPEEIPISGEQTAGWYTSLFRVQLDPAPEVELDFGENIDEFFSLVVSLFREDGGIYTLPFGELTHVWKNQEDPHEVLIEVARHEEIVVGMVGRHAPQVGRLQAEGLSKGHAASGGMPSPSAAQPR